MKKIIILIFLIIVAVFLSNYLALRPGTGVTQPQIVVETPLAESRPYCFVYTQNATPEAPYAVEERLELTRVRGNIIGMKSGTQNGPDMTNGYTGTLTGTWRDGALELTYAYTIDGSDNKELEIYTIDGADLIKQRFALEDGPGGTLVPVRTGTPTLQTYVATACQ